jgi:hypothetical protein
MNRVVENVATQCVDYSKKLARDFFFFNVLCMIHNKENPHAANQQLNIHKTKGDKKQASSRIREHS